MGVALWGLIFVCVSSAEGQTTAPRPSLFARRSVSTSRTNVGYIDTAYVGSMVGLRTEMAYGNDFPDRAEFFYAKCGCFRNFGDPKAPGPPLPESSVDFQTVQADIQLALSERMAAFVELPFRFINPEQNDNSAGVGDVQAGIKFALWNDEEMTITFQLRAYAPTGAAERGLGTAHPSLEPALLLYERLTDRWTLEAELRDWIAIDGSSGLGTHSPTQPFSGNILRYGVGLSYLVHETESARISPVAEFVGWSVLEGQESNTIDVSDAAGRTIVNAKLGLRIAGDGWGSLYAGYGRALTNSVWYEDIIRVEYRMMF